jgi:glycosyltransferase involved in cell wall biosynthesis
MAGPAIRAWELTRVLGRHFSVTLAAPFADPQFGRMVDGLAFSWKDSRTWRAVEDLARQADVVISSGYLIADFPFLRNLPVPWVADVYIPTPVESLSWHVHARPDARTREYEHAWHGTQLVAQHADLLLCASNRQRDFWLGVLAAYGRLRPELYDLDAALETLVAVVPFGCPSDPPQPAPALKGVWPGIDRQDRVLLWGGGIWNWFDPLTLLRAMPQVVTRHPEARLVFLGTNHPDAERVPEMQRAREARALCAELGLGPSMVFWGDWVPYDERGAYLLDADVGLSLHHPGIESRLAFRTRLLDAVWSGLPMVCSQGDVLAEQLAGFGAVTLVPCGAVDSVAAAINDLLDQPDAREARRPAFGQLRQIYDWEHVAEPLVRFCQAPRLGLGKKEALDLPTRADQDERLSLERRIAELENTVRGYESGRVMRLLAYLHRQRRRFFGSQS